MFNLSSHLIKNENKFQFNSVLTFFYVCCKGLENILNIITSLNDQKDVLIETYLLKVYRNGVKAK